MKKNRLMALVMAVTLAAMLVVPTMTASAVTTVLEKVNDATALVDAPPTNMFYYPDGNYLVVCLGVSPYLTIFSVSDGTLTKMPDLTGSNELPGQAVYGSFSSDSKYLAVAHAGAPFFTIYDMTSYPPAKMQDTSLSDRPPNAATSAIFSPNGDYLAVTCAVSPYLLIYDMSNFPAGPPEKMSGPISGDLPTGTTYGASFSPDGKYLAVTHEGANPLKIYDMDSMVAGVPPKITGPSGIPTQGNLYSNTVFSQDGKYLSVAVGSFTALYDIENMVGEIPQEISFSKFPSATTYHTDISKNSKYLVYVGAGPNGYRIYDLSSGTPTIINNTPSAGPFSNGVSAAFSPDDKYLAIGHSGGSIISLFSIYDTYAVSIAGSEALVSGASNYKENDVVNIDAGNKPGYMFTGWTVNTNNVTLTNSKAAITTLVMPADDVTLTANWAAIAYSVTVENSEAANSGTGNYEESDSVIINAGTKPGYDFAGWTVNMGAITLADSTSAATSFTMPAENVTVTANWTTSIVTPPSSDTPTIIINMPNGFTFDDSTDFFEAYKIFSVTFDGDNYSYTQLPEFEAFDGYPTHDTQTLKEYLESHPDADAMTDLATELRNYIKNASPTIDAVGDVTVTDTQVTIDLDDAGYGYYLVFHSINAFDDEGAPVQIVAACALTTTDPVAKFKAKVDVPSLTKYIKLANGALVDASAVSLGDTVNFVLELTLPTTVEAYESYPLIVHDEIGISSNYFLGLDPEGISGFIGNMTVKLIDPTNVLSPIVLTSLQYEATPAPDGFTVEFDYNEILEILAIDDNADYYTTILIEYSTVVNQGILDKMKGTNTAWAQFGADPYSDATQTTPPSTATIYVSCLDDIYKVDGSSYDNETLHNYKTYLADAEFNLYRLTTLASPGAGGILYSIGTPLTFTDDVVGNAIYDGDPANTNTFTTLTSDATGLINAYGLAPGLYMLRETVAPDGYNKLTYDVFFKIEFINDPDIGWTFIKSVYFDSDEALPFLYETSQPSFAVIFDMTLEDHESLDSNEWIENINENVFIENYSGTLFPGTGGIGSTIFYITSILLTSVFAVYILITMQKRKTFPTA